MRSQGQVRFIRISARLQMFAAGIALVLALAWAGSMAAAAWTQYRAEADRLSLLEREAKVATRSEEHTSELQSLMRISYAVFCLQKKNKKKNQTPQNTN